ncbi:MAG: hypothetical protein ABIP74_02745 [Candidatus Saccharimonas sp.]
MEYLRQADNARLRRRLLTIKPVVRQVIELHGICRLEHYLAPARNLRMPR